MNLPTHPTRRRPDLPRPGERHDPAPVEPPLMLENPLPAPIPGWRKFLTGLVQLLVAAAIVLVGVWKFQDLLATAPTADRKPRHRVARLVETAIATPARTGPVIEVWGEVEAAQTLVIRPEVSGTVIWVHPEVTAGGFLPAGAVVALLDDRDLKLAVGRAEATIAQIDSRILLERGQADIGKREARRLNGRLTDEQRALVLRKPQMANLEAERAAAVAARDQARNALGRTEVVAPFAAIVVSEHVAPGAVVAQNTEAATLVAANTFHVKLAVPTASLGWIRFDGRQQVRLAQEGSWRRGASRGGRVVRLASKLSETGRMAQVIAEVRDPLARRPENAGQPKLLLGSFVKGTIETPPVAGTVLVDRAHLRDNDTVWVMNAQNKLEVRRLEILWRGPDHVLVSKGVAPGETIVTTRLATFAPGMALRTRESARGGVRK